MWIALLLGLSSDIKTDALQVPFFERKITKAEYIDIHKDIMFKHNEKSKKYWGCKVSVEGRYYVYYQSCDNLISKVNKLLDKKAKKE